MQVVYTEAISNPTLAVANLPALADIAHIKVDSSDQVGLCWLSYAVRRV